MDSCYRFKVILHFYWVPKKHYTKMKLLVKVYKIPPFFFELDGLCSEKSKRKWTQRIPQNFQH